MHLAGQLLSDAQGSGGGNPCRSQGHSSVRQGLPAGLCSWQRPGHPTTRARAGLFFPSLWEGFLRDFLLYGCLSGAQWWGGEAVDLDQEHGPSGWEGSALGNDPDFRLCWALKGERMLRCGLGNYPGACQSCRRRCAARAGPSHHAAVKTPAAYASMHPLASTAALQSVQPAGLAGAAAGSGVP